MQLLTFKFTQQYIHFHYGILLLSKNIVLIYGLFWLIQTEFKQNLNNKDN